jgi:hypothetical protein
VSKYRRIDGRSVDDRGRRRLTAIEDEKYLFDLPDVENNPIASNLLAVWEIKCHAGIGSFYNDPG